MKLFGRLEKRAVYWLAGLHMAGLYGYGMWRAPVLTAALALLWMLVALHCWPNEGE